MTSLSSKCHFLGTSLAAGFLVASCGVDSIDHQDGPRDDSVAHVDEDDLRDDSLDDVHESDPRDDSVMDVDEDGPSQPSAERADTLSFVPFEAIVKFRTSAPAESRADLEKIARLDPLAPETSIVRFESDADAGSVGRDPVATTWARIEQLRARDDVEYAHPNWEFELSLTPNDTHYPKQWHYPAIQLPAAWDLTTGSSTVRVAILDSGRTTHPDLAVKWLSGIEYDAASEDGNALTDSDNKWRHGIHVASIAAGATNNGSRSAGVCWGCQLLNINITKGQFNATIASVARGIRWAVENGARVINMSFESNGLPCSAPSMSAMYDAAMFAKANNVTLVAAAGNKAQNASNVVPASCPDVIAVAATDPNNALAAYSNHTAVTIAAPGGGGTLKADLTPAADMYGAALNCPADPFNSYNAWTHGVVANWTTGVGDHCDRHLSGTSMATPHVAGVVGLMLSRNPSLTPTQIREKLQSSATWLPGCNGKCGAGLLNALAAVKAAAPLPVNDPKPVAQFTVQCTGLDCTFNGTGSTDNQSIVAYEWILPGQQFRLGSVVSAFMPGYGSKTVRLRVTDNFGQSTEITGTVNPTQPAVIPVVGHYYNPSRSGNGIDVFETSDGGLVVNWYTYETNGAPVWYTSGAGPRNGARWTQPLYRVTAVVNQQDYSMTTTATNVGAVSLDFSTSSVAWFSWVLNGTAGGERFVYLFGGQGRSGSWYVPSQSGWGMAVQESGTTLGVAVSFYDGGQPRWVQGTASPGSNLTIPLSYLDGLGLCPSCGGKGPTKVNSKWTNSSMNLQVANGSSTSGFASTDIKFFNFVPVDKWKRPLQGIQILTKP